VALPLTDNDLDVGMATLDLPQDVEPACARQVQVEKDNVDRLESINQST